MRRLILIKYCLIKIFFIKGVEFICNSYVPIIFVLKIMNSFGQKNAKAFLLLNDKKVLVQLILDLRK